MGGDRRRGVDSHLDMMKFVSGGGGGRRRGEESEFFFFFSYFFGKIGEGCG